LEALGFIEITAKGCAGNENQRRANRFRLTYVNMTSREQPTHDWRRIATIEEARGLAGQARRKRDKRAVELGRRGARARKQKQNPVTETVTGTSDGTRHYRPKYPVTETATTFYNYGGNPTAESRKSRA
jgi:hypothetical protein